MSNRSGTGTGFVTAAFPVALFTVAETFPVALSLPSTLARMPRTSFPGQQLNPHRVR